MVRILRAPSTTSQKTPKNISVGTGVELSKNQIYQRGRQMVAASSRRPVTVKMVRDPASPTSRPEFGQFTNSTNVMVDLGKPISKPRVLDSTPKAPFGKASAGHQKVIPPNNQTRLGGRTLKRR